MKPKLTPAQLKAAKLYQNPDNSLSFIGCACGIGTATIYAAVDALGIPRRTTAKRSRRHRIEMRRAQTLTSRTGVQNGT